MQAFGVVQSDKVVWPMPAHLKKLDLSKLMKLKSIDLGFTQSLHEICLNFTNGAKSSSLKTGKVAGQALKSYEIDASRKISDFYINQVDSTGEIHGLRILDNFGEYLVNEHW